MVVAGDGVVLAGVAGVDRRQLCAVASAAARDNQAVANDPSSDVLSAVFWFRFLSLPSVNRRLSFVTPTVPARLFWNSLSIAFGRPRRYRYRYRYRR